MWLRHFRHKRRTKRFQEFRLRYYEYRPSDCVKICRECHRAIHRMYFLEIGKAARTHGPMREWTWQQAEALMERLRQLSYAWLNEVVSQ